MTINRAIFASKTSHYDQKTNQESMSHVADGAGNKQRAGSAAL